MKSEDCNITPEDFNHTYCRRKHGHDYYAPCNYHIILKKLPEFPNFGVIVGDANIKPGLSGSPLCKRNIYGKAIDNILFNMKEIFPFIKVNQHIVMPDHVHIFLTVTMRTEKHLGYYIGRIKALTAEKISNKNRVKLENKDIFKPNYTDRVIYAGNNFRIVIDYIKENPFRRAMINQNKKFFDRVEKVKIGDKFFTIYGNRFLLNHPFKSAVRVHRRNSREENKLLIYDWLRLSEGGGVLISPFISKIEKFVRDEGEKLGAKIIHIQSKPLRDGFKPEKHRFNLCSEGRMLIIAPEEPFENPESYQTFSVLNDLAEFIASSSKSG